MLTPGSILQNRYRIASLLGQGGMGAVYRAWDTRLEVPVALKEMIPQPGLPLHVLTQLRQQFHQEAKVLARLNHTHLVRVTDYFEETGNVYLVMDFVEGKSLSELIEQKGALPEAEVLKWGSQLLHALAYCHGQGIIHRDIKPQNVIIRPGGQAVLVDFGLVKLWDPDDPRTKTAMRGMGTPEYAPPEQYSAQSWNTDARSDLYGLGATMYHALTGRAPLTATDRMADPEQFVPLRRLNARVNSQTEAVILRAMQLQRGQRFQSAQEMAAALAGQAVPPAPRKRKQKRTKVMPGTQPAAPRRRRRAWAWVLIVLFGLGVLLAGGGGLLWWMAQQGQGPLVAFLTTPAPAVTPTPTVTTIPTAAPSQTPSPAPPTFTPAPTSRPTQTPLLTLTATPDNRATTIRGAGIFAAPDSNSQTLGGVSEGEKVEVLGRATHGDWLYIRDEEGVEGFVYAPRIEWSGDLESLPVKQPIATVPPAPTIAPTTAPTTTITAAPTVAPTTALTTTTPTLPPGPYPDLELELWPLEGYCEGGISYKEVYMGARGGDGVYMYYWNDELQCGPVVNESCVFHVRSTSGPMAGAGKVVSGDGQEVLRGLFVPSACD